MAPSARRSAKSSTAPTPEDELAGQVLSFGFPQETDEFGFTRVSVDVGYSHCDKKESYELSRDQVLADLTELQKDWDAIYEREGWSNIFDGKPAVAFRSTDGFYAGIADPLFLDPTKRPSPATIFACFQAADWEVEKKKYIDKGCSVDTDESGSHAMYVKFDEEGTLTHFTTKKLPDALEVSVTYILVSHDEACGYAFHSLLPRLLTGTSFFGMPTFIYMHIQAKKTMSAVRFDCVRVAEELVNLPLCLRDFLRHNSDIGRKMVGDRVVTAPFFERASAACVREVDLSLHKLIKKAQKKGSSVDDPSTVGALMRMGPFMKKEQNRNLLQQTLQYSFSDNPACPGDHVVPIDPEDAHGVAIIAASLLMLQFLEGSNAEKAKEVAMEKLRRRELHDALEEAERAEKRVAELRRRYFAEQGREARANAPEKPYTARGQQPRSSKKKGGRGRGDAVSAMVSEVHRMQRPIRAARFDLKQQFEHAEAVERKAKARLAAAKKVEADASKEMAARTHVVPAAATVADVIAHAA